MRMAKKKLADKLTAHLKAFAKHIGGVRAKGMDGNYTDWYLHLVVGPSLMDIAERIDAIEASRSKGKS